MSIDPKDPRRATCAFFDDFMQETWELDDSQMKTLFAIDQERLESLKKQTFHMSSEPGMTLKRNRKMLRENCPDDSEETIQRMALVLSIRFDVYCLFLKHSAGHYWLSQKQETLGDRAPMELILSGKLKDLEEAEYFVYDACAGP